MPLTLDQVQNLEQQANAVIEAKAEPAEDAIDPGEESTGAEAPDPNEGQIKRRGRGRPRKNGTAAPKASAKPKPQANDDTSSKAGQVLAAQEELRAACEKVSEAEAERDAVIARIGALCQ